MMVVVRVGESKLYPNKEQIEQLEHMFDMNRQTHNAIIERLRKFYDRNSPDPFGRKPSLNRFDCYKEFGKKVSTETRKGPLKSAAEFENDVEEFSQSVERKATKFFLDVLANPAKNKGNTQKYQAQLKKHVTADNALLEFEKRRPERLAASRIQARIDVNQNHTITVKTEGSADLLMSISAKNTEIVIKTATDTADKYIKESRAASKKLRQDLSKAKDDDARDKARAIFRKKSPRMPKFWNRRDNNIYHGTLSQHAEKEEKENQEKKPAKLGSPFDGGVFRISDKPHFAIKVRGAAPIPYAVCRSFSIVKKGNDYFVQVAHYRPINNTPRPVSMLGLDIGVSVPLATSDGELLDQSQLSKSRNRADAVKVEKEKKKLARMQELNGVGKWSNRMKKQKAKITALESHTIDRRNTWQDQTAHRLAKSYTHIAAENIDYKKLMESAKSRRKTGKSVKSTEQQTNLNRNLAGVATGRFIKKISENMTEYGSKIVLVPPEYSSQTCSHCLHVSKHSRVTREAFQCTHCGHEDHADYNAAKVILIRGFSEDKRYDDDPSVV